MLEVSFHNMYKHISDISSRPLRYCYYFVRQVDVVLRGRQTNDEQTFVKFDKALATGGVAGGVATGTNPPLPSRLSMPELDRTSLAFS